MRITNDSFRSFHRVSNHLRARPLRHRLLYRGHHRYDYKDYLYDYEDLLNDGIHSTRWYDGVQGVQK